MTQVDRLLFGLITCMIVAAGATKKDVILPLGNQRPETVTNQIQVFVDDSVKRNREAKDLAEWRESGFTPADIFRHVRAIGVSDNRMKVGSDEGQGAARETLCAALSHLPAQDLALFEEEITSATSAVLDSACAADLSAKILAHWDTMAAAVAANHFAADGEACQAVRERAGDETEPTVRKAVQATPGSAITEADLGPREVALTFEGGPTGEKTAQVLKTLSENKIQATFFPSGAQARSEQPADFTKLIRRAHHGMGAMGWSNVSLVDLPLKKAEREIADSQNEVGAVFFRFPYGAVSPQLEEAVAHRGMIEFPASVDSGDWKTRDPRQLIRQTVDELEKHDRGIISLHDSYEQTAVALPHLIEELRARKFKTVVFAPARLDSAL